MRKLTHQIDRKSLEVIYMTFIRPVLEHADVVWNDSSEQDKVELDKIQNEAPRVTVSVCVRQAQDCCQSCA